MDGSGIIESGFGDDFYDLNRNVNVDAPMELGALMPPEEPVQGDSVVDGGGGGDGEGIYAFQVINNGDGTVSVRAGSVNESVATGLDPAGQPTELWLKVTVLNDAITGASVVTASESDSTTVSTRQIASITWDDDTPTIVQGLRGNQNVSACFGSYEWRSLFGLD